MGDLDNENRQSRLSKQQKAALMFLLVFGLFGLVFGLRSFSSHARRPFELQMQKYALSNPEYVPMDEREEREREELKKRDTDLDTLNDYDELYVYRTSAFLSDTDSDGIDDATEVVLGENPNCPTGQECDIFTSGAEETGSTSASVQDLVEPVTNDSASLLPSYLTTSEGENPADAFRNMTIAEIRDLLLSNGIPKETLDKIDDATLRKLFTETLGETEDAFEDTTQTQE